MMDVGTFKKRQVVMLIFLIHSNQYTYLPETEKSRTQIKVNNKRPAKRLKTARLIWKHSRKNDYLPTISQINEYI